MIKIELLFEQPLGRLCTSSATFVGVDAKTGTVHTLVTTSAKVADSTVLPDLLHGEERKVWSDGGYQGQTAAIREAAPKAAGHDLPQNKAQALCRRVTKKEEQE